MLLPQHVSIIQLTVLQPSKPLATVHHCLPPDDDRMIETCCGINIGRGEEELLR
jgi:hypothetical protein